MGKENLSANNHHCRQREKLKKLWAEYRNPIFIPFISKLDITETMIGTIIGGNNHGTHKKFYQLGSLR